MHDRPAPTASCHPQTVENLQGGIRDYGEKQNPNKKVQPLLPGLSQLYCEICSDALGGFVELKFNWDGEWKPYGITCSHCVFPEEEDLSDSKESFVETSLFIFQTNFQTKETDELVI